MSGPRPISGVEYFGIPVDQWRAAAIRARNALLRDPNNRAAREDLEDAQTVLRMHVGTVENLQQRAIEREGPEGKNMADFTEANRATPRQAAMLNAFHGASLGIGDEIAAILPGVTREQYRAGRAQLYEDQPIASPVGDFTGSVLLGAGVMRALPKVATMISQGGLLRGRQLVGMGAGAAVAGGEGIVRGLASEGSLGERLQNAATTGTAYAVTGGLGTGLVNRLRLRSARVKADDLIREEKVAESVARRVTAEANAAAAPARVASAENQAALSTARVEDIPVVRANRAAGQTRAAGATERAVERQAAFTEAQPDLREMRQMRKVLLQYRVERANRMRGLSATERAAAETPAGIEADMRATLTRQNYSPEFIERVIAKTRGNVGSGLSPAASTQAEAAALPGTYRPTTQRGPSEAWLQRRNQILGIGQQTPSGVPVQNTGSPAMDAGRALRGIVNQPFSDDLAGRIGPVLQSATPAERQSLLIQVMMGRDTMQPEWVRFLRGILRE